MPRNYVSLFGSAGDYLPVAAGATWLAAINTNIGVDVSAGNAQLRLRVAFTVTGGTGGTAFKWIYAKNGGAVTDITASSSNVKTFNSTHFADGDDVPQFLSSGTYVSNNNAAEESTGAFTLGAAIDVDEDVESEIAIELIAADLANNDTLDFRIVEGDGTVFTTYTEVARITVIK